MRSYAGSQHLAGAYKTGRSWRDEGLNSTDCMFGVVLHSGTQVPGRVAMAYLPRFVIVIVWLVMALWPVSQIRGQAKRRQTRASRVRQRPILSPREIAAKISNSLVLIVTQDREGGPVASGSGFFYNIRAANDPLSKMSPHLPPGVVLADEEIVTSLHVFKRASQGYVKMLGDGVTYKITEIVAIDVQHDLCVFRASGASARPLTVATGTKLAVGDDVYVAGNPRGFEATISKGIVSAMRTDRGLIQIDAAISPGSSGGPVVNTRAEVVGIATSSLAESQNLNFAVDANYLAALPLEWNVSVSVAGALALKDREIDELKSSVRNVTSKTVAYNYDPVNDRYVEGRVLFTETKAYNYDGNMLEASMYMDGELRVRTRLEYNERGFIARRSVSGKLVVGEKSEAVPENESIKSKIDDSNRYDFNLRSMSEQETIDFNGQRGVLKTVRTFDRNTWKTEETTYFDGSLGFVERYRYDVDEQGNWVKRYQTTYSSKHSELGFTPAMVVYREIRYYEGR